MSWKKLLIPSCYSCFLFTIVFKGLGDDGILEQTPPVTPAQRNTMPNNTLDSKHSIASDAL